MPPSPDGYGGKTNHVLAGRGFGVRANPAGVVAVSCHNAPDRRFLGLGDGNLHGVMGADLSEVASTVDNRCRWSLLDDGDLRTGFDISRLDGSNVLRDSHYAV